MLFRAVTVASGRFYVLPRACCMLTMLTEFSNFLCTGLCTFFSVCNTEREISPEVRNSSPSRNGACGVQRVKKGANGLERVKCRWNDRRSWHSTCCPRAQVPWLSPPLSYRLRWPNAEGSPTQNSRPVGIPSQARIKNRCR